MTNRATADDPQPPTERWMRRLLREPILHFLALGAALFAVYSYVNNDESPGDQQIVVSRGKIEHLAALFARTWQRPPTREELKGLIDDHIREEAAYREGLAMGLDRNDTIIRRRLRQKLDFVAEDLINLAEPTDKELASYLQNHQDKFRVGGRRSFRHVYVNPEQHGDDVEGMVSELITALQNDPTVDAREQGDRILLDFQYKDVSVREIRNLFGDDFADSVLALESGEWKGPIRSAYGLHAVIVDQAWPGHTPPMDEVRDAVEREWGHDRRMELTDEFYRKLLGKFEVIVEWPEPEEEKSSS